MGRSFQGKSLLKCPRQRMQLQPSNSGKKGPVLELAAMQGEVHRFEGIVDRFGVSAKATGIVQTICVRQLRHCRTGQLLNVDHWWFRVRREWTRACLSPGAKVLFTAKIHLVTKGRDVKDVESMQISPGRRQCIGFGSRVTDLVVIQNDMSLVQ